MSKTRDAILGMSDASSKVEKVSVPEWPMGHVYVRTISVAEFGSLKVLGNIEDGDEGRAVVAWCVYCICDEAGKLTFAPDDMDALLSKPLGPLMRCCTAAMKLNDAIEGLAGNSEETPSES